MWLSDSYDIPEEIVDSPCSPPFRQFLLNWFGSNRVSFSERLRTANQLTPEETMPARELIRRNLKVKHDHIISGTWVLDDTEAIPILQKLFETESNGSRRLVIAGALWKLNRDPVFIECLNRAKETGLLAVYFHLHQVLWLNDERSFDFLVDLLPSEDQDPVKRMLIRVRSVLWRTPLRGMAMRALRGHNETKGAGSLALSLLNRLETGHPIEEQHPPSYYRGRRNDLAFRQTMLRAINKCVTDMHQGH